MTILFLTDSLSLPREGGLEKVNYEDTFPFLLKKKFKEDNCIFLGIGGATITDLHRQATYYSGLKPDLVFLQCGIVDCAPRPFRRIETRIINKLKIRFLFDPIKNILVKYRNYKFTSLHKFNILTNELNNIFKHSKVYSIGILPSSEEYERKLPGITKAINNYNSILESNLLYIDVLDFPRDGFLSDFHHLNKIGHDYIYKKICSIINKQNA